jgi:uncharacterized protein
MRYLVLLVLAFGLMACSAKPLKMNYYMLYTPLQTLDNISPNANATKIRLNKILLADYLKQSSLTMQINQNEMFFSRQDVWAESLQSSIYNAMLAELNQDKDRQFIAYIAPSNGKQTNEVTLQFDHFHATDQSTVIASGHFWINVSTTHAPIEKSFLLSLPLHEDGYSHAVIQQRALLHLLAAEIQQEIVKLDLK